MSAEPWYFIWHHVDPKDVADAGFAARTACAAIPAVFVGGPVGLAGKAVFGASVAAVPASRFVTVFVSRVSAESGKRAVGNVRNSVHSAKRWLGQVRIGSSVPSTALEKTAPAIGTPLRGTQEHASSFGTRLRQKWGTLAFGNVAALTPLRKHMPNLYRKQKGIDALCGSPLPNLHVGLPWNRRLNPLVEVDHIRPRSRGGSDKFANLQLTHRTYNRAKGNLYGPALSRAKKNFCQYKP